MQTISLIYLACVETRIGVPHQVDHNEIRFESVDSAVAVLSTLARNRKLFKMIAILIQKQL